MKKLITLLVAVVLVGCSVNQPPPEQTYPPPVAPVEPEPAVEEPEPVVVSEGPAEKLMFQASDIGPGWSRTGVEVKAEGCWIDQNFQRQKMEGDILYSEYAVEILWVYPDADSAIANSELYGARYNTQTQVPILEESLEELIRDEAPQERLEQIEAQIEEYQLGLPFWDEAYKWNDIILRKDNIVVFLKAGRNVFLRKYDPLSESSPLLSFTHTPEQEQWLDREHAKDLLFSLAEKAEDRISDYLAENNGG